VIKWNSRNVLEELLLLLEMDTGDTQTLVRIFSNVIIKTVLLKTKSIRHTVGTIFAEKDIQELFVKAVILMEHSGVKGIFRRVSIHVVDVFLHYLPSLIY